MARAIIVYGSTTGSTEMLSSYIAEGVRESGFEVTVKNVVDADPDELMAYDMILLGSSTWGEGTLQDDFVSFHDQMDGLRLDNKPAAAFGPGDRSYDMFCEAVDLLEDRLRECGAKIVAPGLKIDGDVAAAEEAAKEWGKQAAVVRT